jgi:preprotein translocase subunit YajC
MPFDPINLVLFAVLAVMVIFMFRNSRKRKAELEAMREKMVPGAEVMTNFGLFGTLLSVDDDTNIAQVETSPGTILRLHRQTLSRVVEDTTTPVDALPAEPALGDETPVDDSTRRAAKSDGAE